MERKTEKWESLRLDVQKFTPQFCYTPCEIEYKIEPVPEAWGEHVCFEDDNQVAGWDWGPEGHPGTGMHYNSTNSTILFDASLKWYVDQHRRLGWVSTAVNEGKATESNSTQVWLLYFQTNLSNQGAQIVLAEGDLTDSGNPAGVFAFKDGYKPNVS